MLTQEFVAKHDPTIFIYYVGSDNLAGACLIWQDFGKNFGFGRNFARTLLNWYKLGKNFFDLNELSKNINF